MRESGSVSALISPVILPDPEVIRKRFPSLNAVLQALIVVHSMFFDGKR